jgi:uncharacterized protein
MTVREQHSNIFRIKLNGLRGLGRVDIHDTIAPADLNLSPDEFIEKIPVDISLQETADCIDAALHVEAIYHRLCDRCAIEVDTTLKVDFRLTFLKGNQNKQEDSEDIIYYRPDNPEVDISQNIRDAILLAVPMQALCKPDCKGLCHHCGTDLNTETCSCSTGQIDTRWEKLATLRDKINDE